jgi:hypothetical protein
MESMGFQVLTRDGVPIVAATAEDAIALAKAIAADTAAIERRARRTGRQMPSDEPRSNGASGPSGPIQTTGGGGLPSRLAPFMESLKSQQRAAIRVIASARPDIGLKAICQAIGLDSTREASILLSACARMAKRAGLNWSDVVEFRISGTRENRTSIYKAGPLLRGEATER